MLLRFEDRVYIKQWMNFRKPTLKDLTYTEDGIGFIDCGICVLSIGNSIIPK